MTLVCWVISFYSDSVGVFCNPSRLSHLTLVGWVLSFYSDAVDVFYNASRISHVTLVGWVLSFYSDAVGVFYNPADSATGHFLVGSYPSTVMQLVYSTTPADSAT